MAAIGTTTPTLYDLAEVTQNQAIMDVVFPLTEAQDLLKDAVYLEANDLTSHRITRNNKLVSGTWRQINKGIDAAKGAQTPVREEIGLIESRLEVDKKELDIAPNRQKFLEIQAKAHLEGMSNDIADALVLGSLATNSASIDGIETRYGLLADTDGFGQSICHDYGGTGSDLMSILAIQWGPGQVYVAYPRGSKTFGVVREPRGVERVLDSDSKAYYAYVERFEWNGGLVIEDDRCIRRICNIESAGTSNNLVSATDVETLIDALVSMKTMGSGATLYMNRTAYAQLWKAQKDKTNVDYQVSNPWKSPEYWFDGHRVRFTDSLLITESAVA